MQTIIVDVTNEKVMSLLKDMEALNLIRIRNRPRHDHPISETFYDLKKDNRKFSKIDKDNQLEDLRRDWE